MITTRLRPLAGADLYVEWERRLADFRRKQWHNVVKLGEEPLIHYVGLDNQEDDAEDRVVVSIECRLEDYVVNEVTGVVVKKQNERSTKVRLCEYWTLAWTPGGWRIDSIQNEEEGAHHLEAPLVASPWSDEVRLRDEALVGLAVADAAPTGSPSPGELVDVDFADDARAAALDLSLVDGRFAPAVLEAAVRRAVRAWVAAVDGADDRLLQLATPDGAQALLYPRAADRTARLVIRAGVVEEVRIVELHTKGGRAELTVEVALRGRHYVEDRDTAGVLEGERERETTSRERLVLALDDEDPGVPWRVVGRG